MKNVSFVVCNTDSQALSKSTVPVKVQLGERGLGVGGDPVKGREAAECSEEDDEREVSEEVAYLRKGRSWLNLIIEYAKMTFEEED